MPHARHHDARDVGAKPTLLGRDKLLIVVNLVKLTTVWTALLQATQCSMDYVLIDNAGTDATTANIVGDRFCGGQLSTITTGAGLFNDS